jgi:hypothetical protein
LFRLRDHFWNEIAFFVPFTVNLSGNASPWPDLLLDRFDFNFITVTFFTLIALRRVLCIQISI